MCKSLASTSTSIGLSECQLNHTFLKTVSDYYVEIEVTEVGKRRAFPKIMDVPRRKSTLAFKARGQSKYWNEDAIQAFRRKPAGFSKTW